MRSLNRLTDRECARAKHDPKHHSATYLADGGSLYLRIRGNGGRAWIYRYRDRKERGGRVREMGLGGYPEVSLKEARQKAAEAREQHRKGVDLIGARRVEEVRQRGLPTFAEAVADYIAWRKLEGSSLVEWETTLRLHAAKLNPMRVDFIEPEDVAAALKAVWATNRSAKRILNRVEQIFTRCIALRYRIDNPAIWDIQQHLLERGSEAGDGHAAMPWQDIPDFMERLRDEPGQLARALEFIILTASRSGEVVGDRRRDKPSMARGEITLDLWTVPAERMKRRIEHRVPLSDRALTIAVDVIGVQKGTPALFRPLLRKLDAGDVTVHGFRSSFKSWAMENGYGDDTRLTEFALAHSLPNKVEAAYNRTTRVDERRVLMQRWADFCGGVEIDAKVVRLRKA